MNHAITVGDLATYRGWAVTFDYGHYYATSPNYDASWEGAEDGWVDNGERCCARDLDDLYAEVDAWFEDNRDSDGTATAAANGDLPVPKDCQARAESIAQQASPKSSQGAEQQQCRSGR